MSTHVVDLNLIYVHETHNAVLVKETETSDPVWLPKSQTEFKPASPGEITEVTIPEWLAIEKGFL